MKKVFVAGLYHETNTFLGGLTALEDFEVREGEELLASEGDASPLSGVLEVARDREWDVSPLIDLRATPGAVVSDEVVETFWQAFLEANRRGEAEAADGACLVLHGAMVSESFSDVEGELLSRIRSLPGFSNKPVCGVLDLHANFTETMAQKSSALISYRENPHTDARKAAAEAALLLDRLMRTGERLATVREQPDLLWPPSGTATDSNPMRALEERAREIEARNPEILVVNVFAGFPFADVPEAGVCFSAVTLGEPEETRAVLKELSELAWSLREEGSHPGMRLEEAMGKLHEHREGPVLIVEPSDNVGAGAPGENTEVLRAFVEHGVPDAGVIINDPEVARSLRTARVGHRTRVLLGGKSGEIGAEPLALEVEVVSKSDGRFELEDPNSHLAARGGKSVDMGPCVVLRSGKAQVLVTSRRTPPFDLGQWRSQGIDPEALFAIGVKAAAGHRRAYDPIARASYTVDVPGPCSENLRRLEFRHVRRPIYPLDDDY